MTPNDRPEENLFELQNLSLMYGTVIGVNDLHLTLPKGAYALIGPNGAGKSTLIGLMTGALRPTLGSLNVLGENPRHSGPLQQRLGVCPATDLLVHGVSAHQWIVQLLRMSGWKKSEAFERTDQVLEEVGLAEARNRPIHTYSLGMRQRCKIAQAIAHRPELLILDEPFNGLDPIGRFQMSELLIQWAKSGKSLLLASHVLHEVERITDSPLSCQIKVCTCWQLNVAGCGWSCSDDACKHVGSSCRHRATISNVGWRTLRLPVAIVADVR
jgi:ABC-2 type transport system ATP-binding protein